MVKRKYDYPAIEIINLKVEDVLLGSSEDGELDWGDKKETNLFSETEQ